MKNFILFIGSLFFYAWGEPKYIILMAASIVFHYMTALFMERCQIDGFQRKRKLWLIVTICADVLILALFKYSGFFPLPIGISFYTFQAMSYSIDVYRKSCKIEKNLIHFATYITMFPQLIAGPILQYHELSKELHDRNASWEDIFCGIKIFMIGLSKKVLLANNAGLIWSRIKGQAMEGNEISLMMAWMGIVLFAFQIYFDFSGYSDMAMGLGRIMGFHFPYNFRYPYLSKSVTEFFRRWHISLGSWFRDYVYIPLGGSRRGIPRQIFNLLIVWALTGIWHGAGLPFLCWGLWFWMLLVLEKLRKKKALSVKKENSFLEIMRWLYTMIAVLIGWCIFEAPDMEFLLFYLKSMLYPEKMIDRDALYLFMENRNWLLVMVIASTPFGVWIARRLGEYRKKTECKRCVLFLIEAMLTAVIFLLDIAYLVSESYNPFLYFRF